MEKETKKSKKINYMIILVGLLLVFSVVQTIQINALDDRVGTQSSISGGVVSQPQAQQRPVTNSQPTMVGGC